MTTKEIDDFFMRLQGVAQFVVGNCALAEHKKFFLNLSDSDKLDVLAKCGHPCRQGPKEKPVVKIKPGCPSSFGENVAEGDGNEGWCRRKQGPDCAGCDHYVGVVVKVVDKNKKASSPVQMGLFG